MKRSTKEERKGVFLYWIFSGYGRYGSFGGIIYNIGKIIIGIE